MLGGTEQPRGAERCRERARETHKVKALAQPSLAAGSGESTVLTRAASKKMERPAADRAQQDAAEQRLHRQSIADLRQALNEREAPLLSNAGQGTWMSFAEGCLSKFNALLTAAICYVAAIAWMQVTYGEIGLLNRKASSGNVTTTIASEERPLEGIDLFSFGCALVFVTAGCFYGVRSATTNVVPHFSLTDFSCLQAARLSSCGW